MTEADLGNHFLESSREKYAILKGLGEKAMEQLSDDDLVWVQNPECNSIEIIVRHLHGNMMSRWTDTLMTDGEKLERDRDAEFVPAGAIDREALIAAWDEGWACLNAALESFTAEDLLKTITIRGYEHTLLDAIHRQLYHVAYHIGQIVQIAKERKGPDWRSLSIPRGQSAQMKRVPLKG